MLRPLDPYGPVQDLSIIDETNAYCWVDIVVNNADAWVRFEGDGPSNLADPSFAAKAGETNHVVILIGKTYKVTCDMQFSIVGKSDPAIDAWWEDDHTLWLNWPVAIEAWEGNGNSFRMHVDPGCLGGTFVWTESNCPLSGSGLFFSYSCDTNSPCSGCAAKGYYNYEGYAKDCVGGWCGCNYVPVEPEVLESEPDDGPYAGSAAVSFSDAAVIFEDGYVNMPGEFVPRQSTRTTLSCVAHGGSKGGTATFSISGDDKLIRVSGRSLPVTVTVPPEQKVAFEIVYEGKEPSERERDIVATATFTEEDNPPSSSDAFLTAVKVELTPVDVARDNRSAIHRHVLGVHEWVNFEHFPSSVNATLEIVGVQEDLVNVNCDKFYCPWTGGTYWLKARALGACKEIDIDVYEPEVVCRNVGWVDIGVVDQAGLLDMRLALYVEPSFVSFKDLYMEEIPDDEVCPHGGYFNEGDSSRTGAMSHSLSARAGQWEAVKIDASWTADRACRATAYPRPWSTGWKEWRIPVGWGDYTRTVKGRIFPDPTTQLFTIEADGTSAISKYGHTIRRTTDNNVWLDDEPMN